MSKGPSAPLVLVTGVSGYIGSWCAYGLLSLGYRVRGTVRDVSNEGKVAYLRDLCPGSTYQIELVAADLESDNGWTEAVTGCDYVLHVASPFPLDDPKHKDELIRPAVDGTLRVLKAVSAANPRPKRVVLTSSFAAIGYGHTPSLDKVFCEDDWSPLDNPSNPINAYTESKLRAETSAWDFVKNLPEDEKFELATINPTFVQGPMLSAKGCSSADIPRQMLTGQMPALPDIYMPLCHVYDVAKAHIKAMTVPEAAGKRFLVSSTKAISFYQYGDILAAEFKPKGYKPTTFKAPNFLIQTLAFFGDKQAKSIKSALSKKILLAPKNCNAILDMTLHEDPEELVKAMAYAGIANGIIPDKSKDAAITSAYVRPVFDLSDVAKP